MSHAPVMMDGSCNGLQHYAALGLDRPGGAAVNIMPADKPQVMHSRMLTAMDCTTVVLVAASLRLNIKGGGGLSSL